MSKEFVATIGIGSANVKGEIVNPQVETGGTLDGLMRRKRSRLEQFLEEIFSNMVRMSDDLKYLL